MYVLVGLAAASLTAWIILLVGRGLFWLPSPRLKPSERSPSDRPAVVAVIPARNEADILSETLPTVLVQDYHGPFRVTLVDDRSEDGTAATAQTAAEGVGRSDRLTVLSGEPLPAGWSGKVWAMHQGTEAASSTAEQPEWIWFTDADIAHDPWVLGALVDRAESEDRDLVSTMATLRIDSAWDRLLIPAFVYFFAKLYPFRFVANRKRRTAGAAGGCILVRRSTLAKAGGIEAIRSALIDDCALGRLIKHSGGCTWLGYSKGVHSLRGYGSLRSVWDMVARSAYTQLGHSPLKLVGTILGMLFLYVFPPAGCIAGLAARDIWLAGLGGTAWVLMATSFVPMLRHHHAGWWMSPLLPVAGVLYTAMTVSSAWRHARGRGGSWKGRTYPRDRES